MGQGGVSLIGGISLRARGVLSLEGSVRSPAPVKQDPYISTLASFQIPATSSRTRAITFQFRASWARKQKHDECKVRKIKKKTSADVTKQNKKHQNVKTIKNRTTYNIYYTILVHT